MLVLLNIPSGRFYTVTDINEVNEVNIMNAPVKSRTVLYLEWL